MPHKAITPETNIHIKKAHNGFIVETFDGDKTKNYIAKTFDEAIDYLREILGLGTENTENDELSRQKSAERYFNKAKEAEE